MSEQSEFTPESPLEAVPTPQPGPAAEAVVETEEADELEDFVDGVAGDADVPDLDAVITIRTSGGGTRYVPVQPGQLMTASEAIIAASLTITGAYQIWMNGAQIKNSDIVPAGQSITVVGSVKGG